ncbi:MAG: low temperature requirement protein A [Gemmatimonadales bacterium]
MSSTDKKVSWLELFFDLAFAGAVAEVGTTLSRDYTPDGLLRFAFLFVLIWSAWVGYTVFSSRHGTDDAVQRLLTLAQMFAVATMAVNADGPLGGRDTAGFAAAYAAMRMLLALQYVRARRQPASRAVSGASAAGIGAGAVLWLASSLAGPPLRYGLWVAALVVDLGWPLVVRNGKEQLQPDPGHLPERFGLFTLILLGESIIAVMAGMKQQEHWSTPAAASAAAGLAIALALWWCYFDVLKAAAPRPVRTRRDAALLHRWSLAHFPFCLGIALSATGVEHVITLDGSHPFAALQTAMLFGGMALVVGSLAVIASTAGRGIRALGPGLVLAGLLLALAPLAGGAGPVALLAALLAAVLGQIEISRRAVRGSA